MKNIYVIADYENCECIIAYENRNDAEEHLLSLAQELQYEVYYLVYDIRGHKLEACVSHLGLEEITLV